MRGMTVGGVDPSILRELSGVYKPFIKAFKELISNSYDADAANVSITFADDFSTVSVEDDGCGMSPFEFRYAFTRIGGSSRKWAREKTPKGRERIGNKGIGFLALARYADKMTVESHRAKVFECRYQVARTPGTFDLDDVLGVPVEQELLEPALTYVAHRTSRNKKVASRHLDIDWKKRRFIVSENCGPVDVSLKVNARNIGFRATLEFDRLLKLSDIADLEKLSDFALIETFKVSNKQRNGTRVSVEELKPFVRRELRAGKRKGFVRNVASRSGFEQIAWHLSRCTPITYAERVADHPVIAPYIKDSSPPSLESLLLRHGGNVTELRRPLYAVEVDAVTHGDMVVRVKIQESGLVATGYIAGHESVIFPAEYRGISIRVRGVAIGDPTFLGAEFLLTGAQKAALSQITGEINVLKGLDAVDALNPGREGFYDESSDFQTLKRYVCGDGERIRGFLGEAIYGVLRRSQSKSSLSNAIGRAASMRKAIDDVAAGLTHLVSKADRTAASIRKMLKSNRSHVNGLASASDAGFGIPAKIGSLRVERVENAADAASFDYDEGLIAIDVARPEWDHSIVLFDRRFVIVHKLGQAHHPIGELDFATNRILVNWGHPIRSQMDERGYLRTALAWLLARTAAESDADQMMDIAMTLLSFTSQPHD